MDPVEQGDAGLFERFCRADIREDHELLDQSMRIEPFRHNHIRHVALRIEHKLALGEVQIERFAGIPRPFQRLIGLPKRLQDRREQGAGCFVRLAVNRSLRLLVGKLGRRAHQHAMEGMAALFAMRGDDNPEPEGRTIDARLERAEIVRNPLRQHGHHAVRKIHRIAADQGFPVQCRAGPDVMRDIGDGDMEDETTGLSGSGSASA